MISHEHAKGLKEKNIEADRTISIYSKPLKTVITKIEYGCCIVFISTLWIKNGRVEAAYKLIVYNLRFLYVSVISSILLCFYKSTSLTLLCIASGFTQPLPWACMFNVTFIPVKWVFMVLFLVF